MGLKGLYQWVWSGLAPSTKPALFWRNGLIAGANHNFSVDLVREVFWQRNRWLVWKWVGHSLSAKGWTLPSHKVSRVLWSDGLMVWWGHRVTSSGPTFTLRKNVLILWCIQIAHDGHLVTVHYPACSHDGRRSSRQVPFAAAPAHTTDSHCMQLWHTSREKYATFW